MMILEWDGPQWLFWLLWYSPVWASIAIIATALTAAVIGKRKGWWD